MKKKSIKDKKVIKKDSNFIKNKIELKGEATSFKKSKVIRVILISLICVFCVFCVLLSVFYYSLNHTVLAVNEVNATLNISDYVGLNLNTDKLHFGTVFQGGSSVRSVNLTSSAAGYVFVTVDENAKDWLYVSNQDFYVENNSLVFLTFVAWPLHNESKGNYETTLRVYVLKNKNSYLTKKMLKGVPVELVPNTYSAGGAAIRLNIVNNSKSY